MNIKISCQLYYIKYFLAAVLILVTNQIIAQEKYGITNGWIVDDVAAEPLETAQILILNTSLGTTTDKNGHFSLNLPAAEYKIVAQMIGYRSDTLNILIRERKTQKLYIYLKQKPIEQQPISVIGFKKISNFSPMDIDLDIRTLTSRPVLGEVDVFRIVQNLPSVTHTNDYSGLIYIRGSNFDQTQIAYDDVPILNPYHLGGAFSSFNSDGIKTVEFSPGIYDAEHGGYLGGRLNLIPKSRDNLQRYSNKISLGLLSSKISFGKTFGKHSFFIAARRTYFDLIEILFSGEYGSYYFYDIQGNYKYKINSKNELTFNCFLSRDIFSNILEYDEEDIEGLISPYWGNQVVSLKWSYSPNINFNSLSHLYLSDGIAYSNTNHVDIDNKQNILGLKQSFNLYKNKSHLSFGFELNYLFYQGDWNINDATKLGNIVGIPQYIFFDYAPQKYSYYDSGYQIIGYIQDTYSIDPTNKISGGLRFGWNEISNNYFILPRLQYIRLLSPSNSITINFSRNEQYYYTLKTANYSDISAPFSAYFPIRGGEKPLSSNNFAIGYRGLLPMSLKLRAEAYYKKLYNIPAIHRYGQHEIIYNNQNSAGIELLLEREIQDGLSISSSYTMNFIMIDRNGEKFTAPFERRHSFYNEISYLNNKGWQFGIRWNFMTGLPYTPITGKFVGAGPDELDIRVGDIYWNYGNSYWGSTRMDLVYGKENSMNFPPYHRMDINISKAWFFQDSRLWLKLQIMNVYNRYNPIEYDYSLYANMTEEENFNNFPILPSFELEWEF